LWYSNPPWSNSGYGVCARHILRGLKSAGFEIGCAPNFGFSGGIIEVDGYPIYPMGGGFSEVETVEAFKRFGYQVLCAQYDIWPLCIGKATQARVPKGSQFFRMPWTGPMLEIKTEGTRLQTVPHNPIATPQGWKMAMHLHPCDFIFTQVILPHKNHVDISICEAAKELDGYEIPAVVDSKGDSQASLDILQGNGQGIEEGISSIQSETDLRACLSGRSKEIKKKSRRNGGQIEDFEIVNSRASLYSWNHRWRRKHWHNKNEARPWEMAWSSGIRTYNKYGREFDELVSNQTQRNDNISFKNGESLWKQDYSSLYNLGRAATSLIESGFPVPDCETPAGKTRNGILRIPFGKTMGRIARRVRTGDIRADEASQFERIEEIKVIKSDGFVYDFSTTTGYFSANGLIVHNSHLGRMITEAQGAFVPYVPIDHELVLPPIADQLRKYALHTVAMCKYGEKKIREIGVNDVTTIYHGVDCPVFKPMNEIPKEDFRRNLGFEPDSFVIGMVQMNKGSRKLIPRQFEAIKLFVDRNPDVKVRVYAHTEPKRDDAFDLPSVLSFLGLNIVHMPDSYQYFIGFKPEDMAAIYAGCDVLLSATSSEGFGLPIAEAQSCGIPVIATDCTSMTELLEPTPELRVPAQTMDWNPIPARYWLPSIDKTVEALERVLNTDPQQYQSKLRDWALKKYDWSTVIIPQWIQLMQKVGEQIEEKCWRVPIPSSFLTAIKDEIRVIQ